MSVRNGRVSRLTAALLSPLLLGSAPAIAGHVASAGGVSTDVRWSAASGSFQVSVTPDDIVARRNGAIVFSARAAARRDFDALVRDSEGAAVRVERKLKLVSLVGPLLSIRDESYVELQPSAHPGGETRLWTIDLSQTPARGPDGRGPDKTDGMNAIGDGRAVDLAILATAPVLLKALTMDPFIRKAGVISPRSLDDVRESLDAAPQAGAGCYVVPNDWTRRFSVVGFSGNIMQVRIGLPGCGANRYGLTQLGLNLPVSPALKRRLGGFKPGPTSLGVEIKFDSGGRR